MSPSQNRGTVLCLVFEKTRHRTVPLSCPCLELYEAAASESAVSSAASSGWIEAIIVRMTEE